MAVRAGRLIAAIARFRPLRTLIVFSRLFRPGTGLRLAALEVFAQCRGQPGCFSGIGGVGLFVHVCAVSRPRGAFKLRLPGPDPYGKPCPRGAIRPAI